MRDETRDLVVAVPTTDRYTGVIDLVIKQLGSQHSRDIYECNLRDFLTWLDTNYAARDGDLFTRSTVAHYLAYLRDTVGLSPSSINQRMAAVRRLAREAHDKKDAQGRSLISAEVMHGITSLRGVKQQGRRSGNWLTLDDAQRLLNLPDVSTLRGLRDRAMLAVMLGCGLRRDEMVNLSLSHIQQREARWAIVDITGKGRKVRSVPMAAWVKAAIDAWTDAASIKGGYVFKPLNKGGTLASWEPLHPQTIYDTLEVYTRRLGIPDFAPHDARRTFAKLARKGGASLEQIQLSLGHASIQTTERYLGTEQDFTDAPSDHVGLRIEP